ncbi:MAG: methyltransferase [Myxococcales bacterium]
MLQNEARPEGERLGKLLGGYIVTQLVASAVTLRIPDFLAEGPQTERTLAELTGIGTNELRRYLDALEGLELVQRVDGLVHGTALCKLLHHEAGLLHGHARMSGTEYYDAWACLSYALRTGRSAFEHVHGRGLWTYMSETPELARSFARTMRFNSSHFWNEFEALYEFPERGLVVDLGAGDGTLLAEVLKGHPELQGIAVEQAAVVEQVRHTLQERGVSGRGTALAGDLLREVPAGAELYLLKAVIHNWRDEEALQILGNVRRAITGGGRLLLIERSLDLEREGGLPSSIRDLTMLVLFGARDRTLDENRALLVAAGFVIERVLTTRSGVHVLVAQAVPPRDTGPSSG